MPARVRSLLLALLALTLGAGCQVRVEALIDVHDDGSGVVRAGVGLDEEAAAAVPDLDRQLRLHDLEAAGWHVRGPLGEGDGRLWWRAWQRFASLEQANALVAQLSGPDGPFGRLRVDGDGGVAATRYEVTGKVDLSAGVAAFSDAALAERLDGYPVGVPVEEVDPQGDALVVQLAVLLPGRVSTNAARPVSGGGVWLLRPGERVEVVARGRQWRVGALPWAAAAMAAAVGAVVVGRRQLRDRRRGRRQGPLVEASPDQDDPSVEG